MKKLLLLAAGVALVRWLNNAEQEALERTKLPRLPARPEVVRQGTGWN